MPKSKNVKEDFGQLGDRTTGEKWYLLVKGKKKPATFFNADDKNAARDSRGFVIFFNNNGVPVAINNTRHRKVEQLRKVM